MQAAPRQVATEVAEQIAAFANANGQLRVRTVDIRFMAGWRPSAGEYLREYRQPLTTEGYADIRAVIAHANPDASADAIVEAAKTLSAHQLPSAMVDSFTPYEAKASLRRYAAVVVAAIEAAAPVQAQRVAA